MDPSRSMEVFLAVQARRDFSHIRRNVKIPKTSASIKPVRLDRLPPEIILAILSHLFDHEKFFVESCIKFSRTADWQPPLPVISQETTDLRNAALTCQNIMPIAQDSLFHTVCIDDQKRDQTYPTSLFSIVGMRFKIYPSGLIPFAQSTLFKFIRLLINTPHLRGHVKQLHISLTPNRYSDDRDAAMYKVVEDLAALFQAEQDSLSSSAATGKNSKKTALSRFAAWLRLGVIRRVRDCHVRTAADLLVEHIARIAAKASVPEIMGYPRRSSQVRISCRPPSCDRMSAFAHQLDATLFTSKIRDAPLHQSTSIWDR
jgi:hypothetical protein